MPLLTPSQVHIDQPLSNLTLAYVQEQTNFIADKVFPTVDVILVRLTSNAYGWDCLLYTSPSPRDRTRSRMPSSA